MARCMLCSSAVGDGDVVCPHCGGAVADADGRGTGPAAPVPSVVVGGTGSDDPTRIEGGPWADPAAPAGSGPSPWDAPPAVGGASGAPAGAPPGYGPPFFAPPLYGPPGDDAGYGPPGYAPPGDDAGYGPPGYAAPGYAAPGYGPPGYDTAYAAPGYGPPGYEAGYAAPGFGPPGYDSGYGAAGAYPPPGYGWTPAPPRPANGMATGAFITSLVCLILAFACFGVTLIGSPVGAVMGHLAMRRIDERGEQGRGLALAGVIIGWIGTALLILGIGLVVVLAAGA